VATKASPAQRLADREAHKAGIKAQIKAANFERFRRRVLDLMGPDAEAILLKANTISAKEFAATVRQTVPIGDPDRGHLVSTLKSQVISSTGVSVSIGGEGFPYPAHLELGHRARDGTHVPGKAFWFPSKRVTKKRASARIRRAQRQIVKAATSGSSSGGET
jgi:hypothetical protein